MLSFDDRGSEARSHIFKQRSHFSPLLMCSVSSLNQLNENSDLKHASYRYFISSRIADSLSNNKVQCALSLQLFREPAHFPYRARARVRASLYI